MTKKQIHKGIISHLSRFRDWGVKEAKRISIWAGAVAAICTALIGVRSCVSTYNAAATKVLIDSEVRKDRDKAVDTHFETIETHQSFTDTKVDRLQGGMDMILRLNGIKPESVATTMPISNSRVVAAHGMSLYPSN